MDLKLATAIFVGKFITFVLKLNKSGATAAPGLYALKIDPDLIKKLASKIQYGSIIITGTNGKTTSSRLVCDILSTKYNVIHNRQGSNLLRGIASTLLRQSTLGGKIKQNLALWEVDEAVFPLALDQLLPKTIIALNLFRDQLDRYGEIDTIRTKWQMAIKKLDKYSTVILNADDPGIAILEKSTKAKVLFFGLGDKKINLPQISDVKDVISCPNCQSRLHFASTFSSHLGIFSCPKCTYKRPNPNVSAKNLKFNKDFSTSLTLTVNREQLTVNYPLPGLYNVYNVLAAAACAVSYGIENNKIINSIQKFSPAFGRFQSVQVNDKFVLIFLIKNPTGANEVLRTIANSKNLNILAILNDKIADSHDVSWIWDTNWQILKGKVNNFYVSGVRALDMATRAKYANIALDPGNIESDIEKALEKSLSKVQKGQSLIVLPTYTAMISLQKSLHKLGGTKWHAQ